MSEAKKEYVQQLQRIRLEVQHMYIDAMRDDGLTAVEKIEAKSTLSEFLQACYKVLTDMQ